MPDTTLIIGGQSTAPALADGEKFPYLARTVASEVSINKGYAKLTHFFGLKRVSMISDDTAWGVGAAKYFVKSHTAMGGHVPIHEVISQDMLRRSIEMTDSIITSVLRRLHAADTRVIFLALQP